MLKLKKKLKKKNVQVWIWTLSVWNKINQSLFIVEITSMLYIYITSTMICHLVIYVFSLKTDCELTHFYGTLKKKYGRCLWWKNMFCVYLSRKCFLHTIKIIWQMSMVKKIRFCVYLSMKFFLHAKKKKYLADVYGLKISVFVYICQRKVFYTWLASALSFNVSKFQNMLMML